MSLAEARSTVDKVAAVAHVNGSRSPNSLGADVSGVVLCQTSRMILIGLGSVGERQPQTDNQWQWQEPEPCLRLGA